jgi:hypothetical protein
MKGIKISSQNCQSLNISRPGKIQDKKIVALTKCGSDIIFVSDIRLNSDKNKHAVHCLEKIFFQRGYKFLHNSKRSSRGVGILIKLNLTIQILDTYTDLLDNIILIVASLNSNEIMFSSIYGPNRNEPDFFHNLDSLLREHGTGKFKILGGDFNATWDSRDAAINIDVINMQNIPSKFRSEKINNVANKHELTDPYRFLHPNKKDSTYVPNAMGHRNRSRIDYFLI